MRKTVSEYLTFRNGRWITRTFIEELNQTKFNDIKFFYANIIDYIRIFMYLIAAYTITTDWHLLNASLILTATLLDLVDGSIARTYNQCSLFGSGIDWLADLLGQIVITFWWTKYDYHMLPWLITVTSIEIGAGLFDFAQTASLKYPIIKKNQNRFFSILDWCMPLNNYTYFGNLIWYSYTLYCVVRILEYSYEYHKILSKMDLFTVIEQNNSTLILFLLNRYCLIFPTLIYVWCELAFFFHIIQAWIEPSRINELGYDDIIYDDTILSYHGGFILYKSLSNEYKNLIQSTYETIQILLHEQFDLAINNCEIFWINIWKRTGYSSEPIQLPGHNLLDNMVKSLINKYYHSNEIMLDGYGFIVNPKNSHAQSFHIDYDCDYSTLFIPLVPLTVDNAIQYILPSSPIDINLIHHLFKDQDCIDVNLLLESQGHYSVCQCITDAYTVLKMDFGTIHRAVSNQGTYHRPMFFISVIKRENVNQIKIPDESIIETIRKKTL